MGGEASNFGGPDKLDVDVGVVLLFAVPGKRYLTAIR